MNKIITNNDFNNPIGRGYEGVVYNYDDNNVVKIINRFTENKINKIQLLHDLELENFIFPDKLVTLENGKPIGYTMEKVITNDLHDLARNLKKAHQIGMTIVDLNFSNFLVDEHDKIIMIDSDNFTYKDYKTDNFPTLYSFLYRIKVSDVVDSNMDKFSFTMKLLEYLCEESILQFDLVNYHPYRKDLEKFVKRLDIPLDVKSMILHNISEDTNKIYLGNALNKLSSSKQYIYKR